MVTYCTSYTNNRTCQIAYRPKFTGIEICHKIDKFTFEGKARRAGSDGTMSASGSAGPGFDPQRGSKFSFENFQPRG